MDRGASRILAVALSAGSAKGWKVGSVLIGFPEAEGVCAWAEGNEKLAAAKQAASKTGECRFIERNVIGAYRGRLPSKLVTVVCVVTVVSTLPIDVGTVPAGADVLDKLPITLLRADGVVKVDNALLGDIGTVPGAGALLKLPITLPKVDGELLPVDGEVTSPPTLATKVPAALTTPPVLDSSGDAAKVLEMLPPRLLTAKPVPTSKLLTGTPRPVEAPKLWVVVSTSMAIMWIMVLPPLVTCCTTALSMAVVMLPLRLAIPAPVSFSSAPAGSVTGLKAFN